MKYFDLFLNSARQAKSNRFTWFYIFVVLIGQILPSQLKPTTWGEYISLLVWFFTTVLSTILLVGLVYSVSQKELNNFETSLIDSWRKGVSKVIRVGLLNILLFGLLFILYSAVWLLLNKSLPHTSFTTITISIFFRPVFTYGMCAVVINDGSIGASAWRGISMFFRNFLQSLVISGGFVVIQQVLLGIIIVFISESPYREILLLSGNSFSYFEALGTPQIIFSDQVLSLIMYPWITITFANAYVRFISNFRYSNLSSLSQKAGYR